MSAAENVGEGGQTVGRLRRGNVVDVGGLTQSAGAVMLDGSGGEGMFPRPQSRERLVHRRGLDDPVLRREGRGGRGRDGEARGGAFAAGGRGGRGAPGFASAAFLPGGDDLALLVSDAEAALELLAHAGVVGLEARGEAGEADVMDGEAGGVAGGEGPGGGAGGLWAVVGEVGAGGGEVEALGARAEGRGGGRLFLHLDGRGAEAEADGVSVCPFPSVSCVGTRGGERQAYGVGEVLPFESERSSDSRWCGCGCGSGCGCGCWCGCGSGC